MNELINNVPEEVSVARHASNLLLVLLGYSVQRVSGLRETLDGSKKLNLASQDRKPNDPTEPPLGYTYVRDPIDHSERYEKSKGCFGPDTIEVEDRESRKK